MFPHIESRNPINHSVRQATQDFFKRRIENVYKGVGRKFLRWGNPHQTILKLDNVQPGEKFGVGHS